MKKFGKRFWINLVVIIVVGIFSGVFVGNFYVGRYMGGLKVDALPDETAIRDNISTVMRNTKNKSVAQISATNNYILAEYYLNQKSYVKRNTYGKVVAAGFNQNLVSTKALVGGEYYSEEVSKGVVKLATKYYYVKDSDTVRVYKGSVDDSLKTDYSKAKEEKMTIDDFNSKNGVKANYFLNYIVSSNTVLSEKYNGKVGDRHSFSLKLETSYSVKNYMYKIKQTSNSSEFPVFESIDLTFEIGDDFTLYKVEYKEVYKVSIPVIGQVTTTGTLTDEFTYDNSFVIPR